MLLLWQPAACTFAQPVLAPPHATLSRTRPDWLRKRISSTHRVSAGFVFIQAPSVLFGFRASCWPQFTGAQHLCTSHWSKHFCASGYPCFAQGEPQHRPGREATTLTPSGQRSQDSLLALFFGVLGHGLPRFTATKPFLLTLLVETLLCFWLPLLQRKGSHNTGPSGKQLPPLPVGSDHETHC